MQSLAELGDLVSSTLQNIFLSRLGQEMFDHTVKFWEGLVESTRKGVLRPGHVEPASRNKGFAFRHLEGAVAS
jgi:hypothetical protein